jgi:hypothetical protein
VRLPFLITASAILAVSLAGGDIPSSYGDPRSVSDVITRYVQAQQTQRERLRGAQMEVEIDASLPKLEKKGKLRVLRVISKLGKITFKQLAQFIGDGTVQKEVINRYLETEANARENGSTAITPANYNFKLSAVITQNGQSTYIFDLKPKRKADGLFRGALWLDGATGMPLKEKGQFEKKPSVMIKSVEFERDYELEDGLSVVKHLESTVDVRIVGKAELTADFGSPTWDNQENNNQSDGDPAGPVAP